MSSLRSERYSPGPLRLSNAHSFLDSTSNYICSCILIPHSHTHSVTHSFTHILLPTLASPSVSCQFDRNNCVVDYEVVPSGPFNGMASVFVGEERGNLLQFFVHFACELCTCKYNRSHFTKERPMYMYIVYTLCRFSVLMSLFHRLHG